MLTETNVHSAWKVTWSQISLMPLTTTKWLSLCANSIHVSLYFCRYLFLYLSFYLPTHPSISLSFYLSSYLPTHLCLCLFFHVSIYVSIYLSTYLSICLSICLSVYLSTCLSVHLSSKLSFYLPMCLSMHLFIRQVLSPPVLRSTSWPVDHNLSSRHVDNKTMLLDFCWQHQKRSNSARISHFLQLKTSKRSNSARLPSKMESWLYSWRPRTNAFCDFSMPCL